MARIQGSCHHGSPLPMAPNTSAFCMTLLNVATGLGVRSAVSTNTIDCANGLASEGTSSSLSCAPAAAGVCHSWVPPAHQCHSFLVPLSDLSSPAPHALPQQFRIQPFLNPTRTQTRWGAIQSQSTGKSPECWPELHSVHLTCMHSTSVFNALFLPCACATGQAHCFEGHWPVSTSSLPRALGRALFQPLKLCNAIAQWMLM